MTRLRSGLTASAAIISLFSISGCGGHSQPGISPFPAKVTITPTPSTSVQLGAVFAFIASAQNSSNNNVSTSFTFQSSDTSIVNVAPNGVACAGHWDVAFTVCTPGAIGVAKVTATALGANSPPTYVFVHPPIDNIRVNGVLLTNVPIQEPCLSQGQTMTVEAHAYNQGSDITASVGPFTWTANNLNVVKITPLVNQTGNPPYPFATNQATVAAVNPGITQIYATASGTTSTTFYQPQYQNAQGVTSPPLDFFETCLIQNIALEVGPVGSQTNQTSFITGKGAAQNINAVITDVMGNNSLPDSTPITLSKIPLTWTSSNPGALTPPAGCTESCSIAAPSPGSSSITASCSPPTCNIGYPEVPVALSSPQALAACESFFHLTNCEQFIPLPVYSSPLLLPKQTIPVGPAAISGLVTGATGATSVLATSNQCQHMNPLDCTVGLYSVSTNRNVAGSATALPNPLNSLLFDLNGDKAYMGSETNAASINPANVGTGSGAFNSIGSVTGNVLAVSNNGNMAIFSDTQLSPNQVFVVNAASAGAPSVIALTIQQATAAAFTPDGLKAYIFGEDSNSLPALFIYSTLQGLQTITPAPPVGTSVNSIAFSANGAFAYVVEPSLGLNGPPVVTVYNTCVRTGSDPQIVADTIKLTAPPVAFKPLADGIHFIALENNGFDYITMTFTGILPATLGNTSTSLCPVMTETNTVQNFNLNIGSLDPFNLFLSADNSQIYILAKQSSDVLVYNFLTGPVPGIVPAPGILLASNPDTGNNVTPLSGFMTADAGTIVIAGSDNNLHIVSTANGGSDLNPPITFPDLPNYLNPFCTATPSTGPCTFNLLAVKP
jgi:hypothetical protein